MWVDTKSLISQAHNSHLPSHLVCDAMPCSPKRHQNAFQHKDGAVEHIGRHQGVIKRKLSTRSHVVLFFKLHNNDFAWVSTLGGRGWGRVGWGAISAPAIFLRSGLHQSWLETGDQSLCLFVCLFVRVSKFYLGLPQKNMHSTRNKKHKILRNIFYYTIQYKTNLI